MDNVTQEQRLEVLNFVYGFSCRDVYEKLIKKEWTVEMFELYCQELYQEGVDDTTGII